jgi:NmrA-like family
MASYTTSRIFVIGGTGAQGIPVIKGLVRDKKYHCRVLTRDTASLRAKQLLALGNVELVTGTFASEKDLRAGFRGCDGAFVNIDGFNCGEKTEIYWAIRSYEIALEEGVKFFVYGNLDYVYKKSGYDPKFRTGHYDGKGRVGEWLLQQTKTNQGRMGAAVFTTGPYIEMSIASMTIFTPTVEDGVVTWRVPLGPGGGGVVHVALDDCEHYVRWLFDHPQLSNGMDLEVAIDHVSYHDLAKAFEKVTGHPARYIDTSLEDFWTKGPLSRAANAPSGYNSDPKDPAFMTFGENFTGFFNMWRYSEKNEGVIRRNYALLDEIFPGRISSAEDWFRREDEKGRKEGKGSLWERVQKENLKPVLKLGEDGRQGKL